MKRLSKILLLTTLLLSPHVYASAHEDVKLSSGQKKEKQVVNRGTYKYYKIKAYAGDTVKVDLTDMDANANLYVRVGAQASKERSDDKSVNGGHSHNPMNESCSVSVDEDSYVYIAVYAPLYGSYSKVKHSIKASITTSLRSGEPKVRTVDKGKYKYYKIKAHAGDTVKVNLYDMDANGNLYVKVGSQASIKSFDRNSENGGESHDATPDSCSVPVNKDGYVYIAVHAPTYGCYKNVEHTIMASVSSGEEYKYGQMPETDVKVTKYAGDNKTVVYHPSTWSETATPVIFFIPGFRNTRHASYETLLKFIASHGYSVIYAPYGSRISKYDKVVTEFKDKLNTNKIGVLGHSSGGGEAFNLLKHMIANNYGKEGRFMMSLDGYFAQFMDKIDMKNLTNTNILLMQLGTDGLKDDTDPRIVITSYRLLTGAGIDKNYIVLQANHKHDYPNRQDINKMQDMLKPLDALMEYTFKQKLSSHHAMALEGPGKVNPLANKYQIVLPIKKYGDDCHYANSWHKGADRNTQSTIDNCGEPEIQPNSL